MTTERPIRAFVAKTSLDAHWRGPVIVVLAMRDAGIEVIYGGVLNPNQIVDAVVQEDVDVLGLNIGGRYSQVRIIMDELKKRGLLDDILTVVGGTIPPQDIPKLKEMGIDEVFPPGSPLDTITDYIKANVKRRKFTKTT